MKRAHHHQQLMMMLIMIMMGCRHAIQNRIIAQWECNAPTRLVRRWRWRQQRIRSPFPRYTKWLWLMSLRDLAVTGEGPAECNIWPFTWKGARFVLGSIQRSQAYRLARDHQKKMWFTQITWMAFVRGVRSYAIDFKATSVNILLCDRQYFFSSLKCRPKLLHYWPKCYFSRGSGQYWL